ncbi:MAG: site-specific integrase [Ahniella sp.]|nr:site-specific integrase [Ahniella sp.]
MNDLDRYLQAATRDNTRKSYAQATRHFEVEWGGVLPATPDMVARYLAQFAGTLANNTLRHRMAALSRWHSVHGFVDPTRSELVKQTLKGIRAVHGARVQQAVPLQITHLQELDAWLTTTSARAKAAQDRLGEHQALRDRALLLVGFWRAFRSADLVSLQVRDVAFDGTDGMTLHLAHSKGDRGYEGRTYGVPALSRLCPVRALSEWLRVADLHDGPVFRRITRWGTIGSQGLHPGSLVAVLRRLVSGAGIPEAANLTSHSLRRGLAGWANENGWDLKSLMAYVGWKDMSTALRYVDVRPTAAARIEAGLASREPAGSALIALPAPASAVATPDRIALDLTLLLSSYGPSRRGLPPARKHIESITLARYRAQHLDKDGSRYRLRFDLESPDGTLDERVAELLDELHRAAAGNNCYLEASLKDPASKRCWD